MKYTYLLINIFTILIPLSRSFEPKLQFYRRLRFYIPAMLITAIFFLVWDYYKTLYGVWSFNPAYITGIKIAGLPLEEILFFITVPYACTFIYASLGHYIGPGFTISKVKTLALIIAVITFLLSFAAWGKAYTWSVLFIVGLWLPVAVFIFSNRQLSIFLLAYAVSLLPMLVVNGLLTALPIVQYNNSQNLAVRLGTIPVEDFIYCFILLSMNIALYEWFAKRQATLALR